MDNVENNKLENFNKLKNIISFENNDNQYPSDKESSLQGNFQKFLKMRKDLRKSHTEYDKTSDLLARTSWRDSPERMKNLREKFVNQAMSYLGIPYGKRYLEESHPLFSSPIFLDCCGLVRQCVNDLKEDFGFMLGRWNQAYQCDTCPQELKFSELIPGDLIFYTATFFKEKGWKSQPHDMVHVEIYLGGNDFPERTIGSRDRFGVVELNDTYQFTSENYYDIKYHFRSLDTWLRGIHKSFCLEHKWHDELLDNNPNKFSVFNSEKVEENEFAEEHVN